MHVLIYLSREHVQSLISGHSLQVQRVMVQYSSSHGALIPTGWTLFLGWRLGRSGYWPPGPFCTTLALPRLGSCHLLCDQSDADHGFCMYVCVQSDASAHIQSTSRFRKIPSCCWSPVFIPWEQDHTMGSDARGVGESRWEQMAHQLSFSYPLSSTVPPTVLISSSSSPARYRW